MEVPLSEYQNAAIKDIAEREGFSDFELKTAPGSAKGDNYLGVITKVSIKDHRKSLELILKSALPNENLRKTAPIQIRKIFLKEIYIYKTIFPAFEEFQKEQGVTYDVSRHPKVYGSSTVDFNEFFLMENLKEKGYELWDRKIPINEDHAWLVFAEYGKFHAVSLAMRAKKPELFEKLTENMDHEEKVSERLQFFLNIGFKAMKGNQIATDALDRISLVGEKLIDEDIKAPEARLVLLHGDCWCNNLLFKYKDPETRKPSKVCMIDWQISTTGTPVMDLSHFFFACCPKEILTDYRTYLKVYHDNVCEVLKRLDCDPETVFPFSLLESHWIKYAKYGVLLSLFFLRIMLGEEEDVIDLNEIAEKKNILEKMKSDIAHQDRYNERISDVLTVSAENGWV